MYHFGAETTGVRAGNEAERKERAGRIVNVLMRPPALAGIEEFTKGPIMSASDTSGPEDVEFLLGYTPYHNIEGRSTPQR